MKTLRDITFQDKKVVMRAGFDVPLKDGQIVDDSRIKASLDTINFIQENNPSFFVIINHIGRPEGEIVPELSNKIVAEKLSQLCEAEIEVVKKVEDLKVASESPKQGKIYMLENLRFWDEEKKADEEFSKSIGDIFDIYVNDAFSVSHRAHASFVGVPKYTKEKSMGLLFEKEYINLTKIKDEPEHPAIMVIGGAKIETKLPVIENMMKTYDKVLVGGMIANEALDQGLNLGEKVVLPVDFSPEGKQDQRLDVGPKTVEIFEQEIAKAKTIVWNGPLGKFEDEDAEIGTKKICQAIAENSGALQVLGGGETIEAVKKFAEYADFDYISMSGGAMLEYLAGKELPGIVALKE